MIFKRKVFICFLALCLCITSMVNITTIAADAEENDDVIVTLEDVIAGMADPSQLPSMSARVINPMLRMVLTI